GSQRSRTNQVEPLAVTTSPSHRLGEIRRRNRRPGGERTGACGFELCGNRHFFCTEFVWCAHTKTERAFRGFVRKQDFSIGREHSHGVEQTRHGGIREVLRRKEFTERTLSVRPQAREHLVETLGKRPEFSHMRRGHGDLEISLADRTRCT